MGQMLTRGPVLAYVSVAKARCRVIVASNGREHRQHFALEVPEDYLCFSWRAHLAGLSVKSL